MLETIFSKLKNLIKSGRITRSDPDTGELPNGYQVAYMGKTSPTMSLYPYGTNARPPINTPMILFNTNCSEAQLVGTPFATDNRFKNLQEGEFICGNILTGDFVKFNADGSTIVRSSNRVTLQAPTVIIDAETTRCTGELQVEENVTVFHDTAQAFTMSNFRDIYNNHTHNETGSVTEDPNQKIPT